MFLFFMEILLNRQKSTFFDKVVDYKIGKFWKKGGFVHGFI